MTRAVLVGAAPSRSGELARALRELKVSSKRDLVIGIDGGSRALARAGVDASLLIGDWDSARAPRDGRVLVLPREKDRSDLHYALAAARNAGARQVVVLGATGGRPDHHLASLLELSEAAKYFDEVSAHGPEADYFFLTGPASLRLKPRGPVVSILPLRGAARGVTLRGMRYALKNADLSAGSHGLSNEWVAKDCQISVKSGSLGVIVPRRE